MACAASGQQNRSWPQSQLRQRQVPQQEFQRPQAGGQLRAQPQHWQQQQQWQQQISAERREAQQQWQQAQIAAQQRAAAVEYPNQQQIQTQRQQIGHRIAIRERDAETLAARQTADAQRVEIQQERLVAERQSAQKRAAKREAAVLAADSWRVKHQQAQTAFVYKWLGPEWAGRPSHSDSQTHKPATIPNTR
jgi:hypothetical protein